MLTQHPHDSLTGRPKRALDRAHLVPYSRGEWSHEQARQVPPSTALTPTHGGPQHAAYYYYAAHEYYGDTVLRPASMALTSMRVSRKGIVSGNLSRRIATSKQSPKSMCRILPE